MDFILDRCQAGRLTTVDEFARECPDIAVDTSLPVAKVVEVLDRLAAKRGRRKTIIVDNGSEFI